VGLDTDPGVDDALEFLLAFNSHTHVPVELTRGMTVVDRRYYRWVKEKTNTEIIFEVNAERFLELMRDRLSGE
jgi:inosine-uridine nucleoside N-ribohydrolase